MGISPRDEGIVAKTSGMSDDTNPYEEGSDAASEWIAGYDETARERSEAFDEGVDAYGREEKREACPYPVESDEREEWQDGWDEAKHYDTDDEVKDNQ